MNIPGQLSTVDAIDTKMKTRAPQLGNSRLGIWNLHTAEEGDVYSNFSLRAKPCWGISRVGGPAGIYIPHVKPKL